MKSHLAMGAALLLGVTIGSVSVGGLKAQGKASGMLIHNVYVDSSGESHFRGINVQWAEDRPSGKTSKQFPATGIIFRETSGAYDLDWHPHHAGSTSLISTLAWRSLRATARSA